MSAYSFLNVNASIVGPGGSFSLGSGAGVSEEGITIEMLEDKGDTKSGADGQIMQTLRASKLGRVTVRLLKTSPINAQLSGMYNLQAGVSSLWGNNTIVVTDTSRGDLSAVSQCSFTRQPNLVYAKDGNFNDWVFQGVVDMDLGSGNAVAS